MKDKLRFEEKLTEEVRINFDKIDLFTEIMSGLEEALDYAKGNPRPTTVVCTRSLRDNTESAIYDQSGSQSDSKAADNIRITAQ